MKNWLALHWSISTRLALWFGLNSMIVLSLVVVFLYTSLHLSLHQDLEERLQHEHQELSLTTDNGSFLVTDASRIRIAAYRIDSIYGTYVRLLDREGGVLDQSPNFAGHPSFGPRIPKNIEEISYGHLWGELPAKTLISPFLSGTGSHIGWLEVTRWESQVHNELHRLRWFLGLGILLGVALAIAGGQWLAKRALRPVSALNDAANSIKAQGLGARLPTNFAVRDGLTALAETFNSMLDRLDASFDREQRCRADAAHEMLTPLSAILSEADVTLRYPRDTSFLKESIQRIRSHSLRMTKIVKNLLFLSRVEALKHIQDEEVDLSDLTSRHLEQSSRTANAKQIHLIAQVRPGIRAVVDAAHARTILDNLIDNAIKYTPRKGTVNVTLRVEANEAVLTVTDTGIGFKKEEGPLLFDRFYRANTDTMKDTQGSGLGLSIVRAAAHAYGGSVSAYSEGPGTGSSFEVRIPGRLSEPYQKYDLNPECGQFQTMENAHRRDLIVDSTDD